ncbi:hypothetical protein JOQ06_026059, partial [Pogonophryne albipinna]
DASMCGFISVPSHASASLLLSARCQADSDISFLNRVTLCSRADLYQELYRARGFPDALIWDGSASLKHYKDEELYRDYDSQYGYCRRK